MALNVLSTGSGMVEGTSEINIIPSMEMLF